MKKKIFAILTLVLVLAFSAFPVFADIDNDFIEEQVYSLSGSTSSHNQKVDVTPLLHKEY